MIRFHHAIPVLLLACSAAHAATTAIPTDQDLQQLFDAKEYRACLQQSARILQLKGDAAKPYDPFVIHMRRAECLVALNDGATALSVYQQALKAAQDGLQAELARANIVMIKGSRALVYTPPGGGAPINIVKIDDRRRAMSLLLTDLLKTSKPQYTAAMASPNIGPIIDFFPKAQELHALEMVGTGADTQTQVMLLDMGERARTLLEKELRAAAANLDAVQSRANQLLASGNTTVTINGYSQWVADTRMGLSPDDRESLRSTGAFLEKLHDTALGGKQAAQSFGRDGKVWDPLIADSQELIQRAMSVLGNE